MTDGITAIIGAGLAGITIARALAAAGRAVTLFDKGAKPGGRLATRRAAGFTFNHGCQFASPRDPQFRNLLEQAGAQPWPQAGPHRLSGVPDMAVIAERLSQTLTIQQNTRITAIQQTPQGWTLTHGTTTDNFTTLVLAIPAPQAADLLPEHPFQTELQTVHLAPCWAVMLGYHETVSGPDLLRPAQNPLSWIAREISRPGNQNPATAYTLHASPAWSTANLEATPETVIPTLTAAFAALTGITTPPAYAAAHRWRYALADRPLGQPCLWDAKSRLGLAGDWCLDGRLEAAYLSGFHLAELILA